MADATSRPSTLRMILVPALITLAVTIVRLIGERKGWDPRFFNKEAGGGFALFGIAWLPLLFGIFFARTLVYAGLGPASKGRALVHALIGLAIAVAGSAGVFHSTFEPRMKGLLFNAVWVIGALITAVAWKPLARVDTAYGFLARVPVVVIAYLAMKGGWGTHYEKGPPGFPEMALLQKWFWLALLPQMVVWVAYTVITGGLAGAITALAMRRDRASTP